MAPIDRRGILREEVFTYRAVKQGGVHIAFHGKPVVILRGAQAEKFLSRIQGADAHQAQLLMARATGHFKHGNERDGKQRR